MSWLDIVLGVILGFFLIRGLARGIVREIVDISAVLATLVLASRYGELLGGEIAQALGWDPKLASLVGFISIALGVAIVAYAINFVWGRLGSVTPLSFFDKLGGALVGLAKASLLILAFLVILTSLPVEDSASILSTSYLARSFMQALPLVYQAFEPIWPQSWPKVYLNPEGWWIDEGEPPPTQVQLTGTGEV